MDKVSDFLKELRIRLSNPLVFSFLLAWIFINWKVTTGLIFYKIGDLKQDHYTSYIDLIRQNYSAQGYYISPLIIAVFYTFCFPFIRMWIKWFQVWVNTKTDKRIQVMTSQISIPMEKYLKDREQYISNAEQLKEILEKESTYINENLSLRSEKNQLSEKLNEYDRLNNNNFLNGYWNIRHILEGTEKNERININNGTLYRSAGKSREEGWLKISNYGINPGSKELVIIFEQLQLDRNPSFNCVFRYLNDDKLILRCYEDNAPIIEMDKYQKPRVPEPL
jgi:hypothetical protein